MTWDAAAAYCESVGAFLPSMKTKSEQAFLRSKMAGTRYTYWLGIREGSSTTHDGTPSSVAPFAENYRKPAHCYDAGKKKCGRLNGGFWAYINCVNTSCGQFNYPVCVRKQGGGVCGVLTKGRGCTNSGRFLSGGVTPSACRTLCELQNEAGCCEFQPDWKKCEFQAADQAHRTDGGRYAAMCEARGNPFEFTLRGDTGEEIVEYGGKRYTLTTEPTVFKSAARTTTLKFVNDGLTGSKKDKNVRFATKQKVSLSGPASMWRDNWKCGTSGENERCGWLRSGVFGWGVVYNIEFQGEPLPVLNPRKPIGGWPHVPPHCSFQSRGDGSVHFNTKPDGKNDGGYTPICEKDDDDCYIGCFVDDPKRDFEKRLGRGYDVPKCRAGCEKLNFKYFGVQDRDECFCGNAFNTEPQYKRWPDGQCHQGSRSQSQGAGWRNSIYAVTCNRDNL